MIPLRVVPLSSAEGHGTLWRVLEGVFSKRDHEFESGLLQRGVYKLSVPLLADKPRALCGSPLLLSVDRISEDIAATPHRLDVMPSAGRLRQLLTQFTHEDINDLDLRLVHFRVEVVQEHLLR